MYCVFTSQILRISVNSHVSSPVCSPCRRKLKPLPRTAPGFPAGTVRENARLTDSLEQHTSLTAAGHGLHPALAPHDAPESSGDGGQLEHSIRAPTYEEVKEFCLLSGGGYGETDPSTGKFCLGAYSELPHEQGAGKSIESSAQERELFNDSHRGCMGCWCQSKSKKSQVSPTQPTPVKQVRFARDRCVCLCACMYCFCFSASLYSTPLSLSLPLFLTIFLYFLPACRLPVPRAHTCAHRETDRHTQTETYARTHAHAITHIYIQSLDGFMFSPQLDSSAKPCKLINNMYCELL